MPHLHALRLLGLMAIVLTWAAATSLVTAADVSKTPPPRFAKPSEIATCEALGHPPESAEYRGCLHAGGLAEPPARPLSAMQVTECHAKARRALDLIPQPYMTPQLNVQALATAFQNCVREAGASVGATAPVATANAGAFGSAGSAAAANGLRPATSAEVAECRAAAGKFGAVITLDANTKEFRERKPDAADKAKYAGPIFQACLREKGAAAPVDAPIRQVDEGASPGDGKPRPMRPLTRDGAFGGETTPSRAKISVKQLTPDVTCSYDETCSAVRMRCNAFCMRRNRSMVCNDACTGYHTSCLKTGIWRSQYCRLMGLSRQ